MRIPSTPKALAFIWAGVLLFGCLTPQQHRQQTHGEQDRQMTVGTVQREIKKGMSAAEVAEVLGSPNIVTTDAESREVWIYDKISTEVTYSESSGGGGFSLLIGAIGGSGAAGAAPSASYSKSTGARSKTQRTLTVIIKYDEQKKVRDFAYHTSRF